MRAAEQPDLRRLAAQLATLEQIVTYHPATFPRGAAPSVSVIMPTYNRARIVPEAIASVVAQSYTGWELVIVDDGSEDGTDEAVAPFLADPRVRFVRQRQGGPSSARNRGLREAATDIIAFLDSDNLFYPDFLGKALTAFEEDQGLVSAYGVLVSEAHRLNGTRMLFRPFDRAALLDKNYIDLNALVCRRSELERVGGFDESLQCLEDWDIVLKLTENGPASALPILAARYRVMDDIRVTKTVPREPALVRIFARHQAGAAQLAKIHGKLPSGATSR